MVHCMKSPPKINKNIISGENVTLGTFKASLGHMARPCLKTKKRMFNIEWILLDSEYILKVFYLCISQWNSNEDQGVGQK